MGPSSRQKIILLILILFAAIGVAICKGSVAIPIAELFSSQYRQVIGLRLARIVLAIVSGGGLAVAGAALQAILRNALAEPYLLGTSSGAGLGAVIALMAGLGSVYLPAAAFAGSIASIILVYNLARQGDRMSAQSLVLSGVIISIVLSGIMVFLISISGEEVLHSAMWWLWGSLEVTDFGLLSIVSAAVTCCVLAIVVFSQDLNAISLGEETAAHLGIRVEAIKIIIFILTSLITACLVCICGMIGFVGLIIPHAARLVIGPNHKVLLPGVFIAGAAFMVICDAISRTVFSPSEIPIGVITSVIGAPVFIVLLKRNRRAR